MMTPAEETAWLSDDRNRQMILLFGRVCGEWGSPAHRRLVQTACEFVRRAMPLVPSGEPRPQAIFSIVEEWAGGGSTITRSELGRAADSADEAAESVCHVPEAAGWHYPAAYAVCCVATAAVDDGSDAITAAVDARGHAGDACRHDREIGYSDLSVETPGTSKRHQIGFRC